MPKREKITTKSICKNRKENRVLSNYLLGLKKNKACQRKFFSLSEQPAWRIKGQLTRAGSLVLLSMKHNHNNKAPLLPPSTCVISVTPTLVLLYDLPFYGCCCSRTETSFCLSPCPAGGRLYNLPRFVIMNYHMLGGLNHQNVLSHTVLGSWRPKSRCQQGWFLLEALRKILFHACPSLSSVFREN